MQNLPRRNAEHVVAILAKKCVALNIIIGLAAALMCFAIDFDDQTQ